MLVVFYVRFDARIRNQIAIAAPTEKIVTGALRDSPADYPRCTFQISLLYHIPAISQLCV